MDDMFSDASRKVTHIPFHRQPSKRHSDDKERKNASILESIYWQTIGWVHTPSFIKTKMEPDYKIEVPKSTVEFERYKFYTKRSFQPKLQIEDKVPYGTLPRDVASDIERRRFAEQDLKSILSDMDIGKEALLPQILHYKDHIEVLKKDTYEGIPPQPFLELDMFDDAYYFDVYSPEEWLKLGDTEDGRKPLPALAFIPDQNSSVFGCLDFDWRKVEVPDYDSNKKLYLVRKALNNQDDNSSFCDGYNSEEMWIPRIYLKFDSEEPFKFAKRLQTAIYTRHMIEESIRMNYYVECMPTENCPEWSKEDLDDIIEKARRSRILKPKLQWIKDHLKKYKDELQVEYKRAYNFMCYMEMAGEAPCLVKNFKNVNLFEQDKNISLRYQVDFPFEERLENFQCKTFYTSIEAIRALCSVEENILLLRSMSLYDLPLNDIQALERFDALQKAQLESISKYLHKTWMPNISKAISLNMENCGRGQYDLNHKVIHTFQFTKLGRLLKMVTFKMQDVIRYLVMESLEKYVSLFQAVCLIVKNVEDNFIWTESLCSDKFAPPKNPVFEVPLKIKENRLQFLINLQDYERVVDQLFDKGLYTTKDLFRIQKFVMKKMLYNPDDKLDTVGEKEKQIILWKMDISRGMKKAILVASAYIRAYDEPLKSFKTDQINYVKEFARKRTTSDELKRVIEMHNREKIRLQNTIPTYLDIGPFRLMTISVRQAAIQKHQQLADAVLNYFYTKLQQFMEHINNDFLVLLDRIDQPTGNIEDLVEKKQWCRTVPKKIEKICVDVNQLRSDVKLISTFNRNMDDEDANTYWLIQKLPQETMKKLHHRVSMFDEEKKEHREHLRSDQELLNSNLRTLEKEISDFVQYSDLEKVSAIAIEVRKARKNLAKFHEQSQLYQKREKLFGLRITDYPKIAELSKKLSPFEKFWLSAAEFNKYKEVDDRDLSTMDTSQFKQAIEEFRSNLLESLQFFTQETHSDIYESVSAVLEEVEDFRANRLSRLI